MFSFTSAMGTPLFLHINNKKKCHNKMTFLIFVSKLSQSLYKNTIYLSTLTTLRTVFCDMILAHCESSLQYELYSPRLRQYADSEVPSYTCMSAYLLNGHTFTPCIGITSQNALITYLDALYRSEPAILHQVAEIVVNTTKDPRVPLCTTAYHLQHH